MKRFDVRARFQGSYTKARSSTEFIVVHHAAALYRQATGIEDVTAVANYHTHTKGWPGIGYHIALAESVNGGRIARYDLSDLDLQRAHVAYQNHRAIAVSCLTNFTGLPEQKWIDALSDVLRELRQRYPAAQIVGHREITVPGWGSACPGPRWFDWKPQLLAQVRETTPGLKFRAPHRISADQFVRVLEAANSPAARYARDLADIPGAYGIDRAVALAFFAHESHYGTKGVCAKYKTKNWGNVRTPVNARRGYQMRDPYFFKFYSWQNGLKDWCERIVERYIGAWGLTTVETATPVYAPSSDGNRPAAYAASVRRLVEGWQRAEMSEGVNRYRVINGINWANVRQGRSTRFPVAGTLQPGAVIEVDDVTNNWAHMANHLGFVHMSLLRQV